MESEERNKELWEHHIEALKAKLPNVLLYVDGVGHWILDALKYEQLATLVNIRYVACDYCNKKITKDYFDIDIQYGKHSKLAIIKFYCSHECSLHSLGIMPASSNSAEV